MRRIVCSLVMLLVLAGSTAFASQNKNAHPGKGSQMSEGKNHHGKGHHKGHHGKGHHKASKDKHNKNK